MLADDTPSLILLTCTAIVLIVSWEIAVRRPPSAKQTSRHFVFRVPPRLALILLGTLICSVGLINLIPWITLLPGTPFRDLLPGIIFIALLTIGAFYGIGKQ